ncbi:MAG: hypothetical protein IJW46_01825 [Clostridia bacterium]|nr:hypothetical protein [Clostridia bacterium]
MKKILAVLMAAALLVSALALVACGDDPEITTSKAPETTTAPTTTKKDETPTTPEVENTTTKAPETTVPETTEEPVAPVQPTLRDPAKVYHVESTSYKTSNRNEDYDFIFIDQAGSNANERFADGTGFVLYQIPLTGMIEPTVTITIRQQYYVAILPDLDATEDEYIKIASFADIKDQFPPESFNDQDAYVAGTNIIDITINPYEHEMYEYLYLYIGNSNPSTGWGGTIMKLTINQYVEGEAEETSGINIEPGTPNYKTDTMTQIEEVILTTADDADEEYIYINTASATDTRRYCDGNAYLIYTFNLRDMYEPTFDLYLAQNYKIEVSPDGQTWTEIANFATSEEYQRMYEDFTANGADSDYNFVSSGDLESGNNFTHLVIDPYTHDITGQLFIKISDCFPSAGWGGAVENITIRQWVEPAN